MFGMMISGLEFHERLGPKNYQLVTRALSWNGPEAMERILAGVPMAGAMVADIGIGTGGLSDVFRKRGAKEIVGVDGAQNFLADVAGSGKADRIARADLTKDQIPLEDDSMDLVTSSGTLSYLQDPSGTIREMVRITKIDGYMAVNFHPSLNPLEGTSEVISASSLFRDAALGRVVYTLYHHPVPEITGVFAMNGTDYVTSFVTARGVMRARDESWMPLATYLFQKTRRPLYAVAARRSI